jgi:hypothetical protein
MMEILLWTAVGLYVVIAFYTLAENSTGKHVKTRDVGDVVRGALEAAAWPLALLPWRELPALLQQWARQAQNAWAALPVRYADLP